MDQRHLRREVIGLLALAWLVTGCATSRTGVGAPDDGDSLPAVQSLVDSAHAALAADRYDDAAADLERALRLQPENAALWRELAQVRRDQRQYDQAISLALRSNSYADADLQRDNWRFIADCRRALGDEEGALEAEARAEAIE